MPHLVWQFVATPLLIGVVLGLIWLIFLRVRAPKPPDFWKLAARRPNEAYDWFISHDGWVVVDFDRRHHEKPKGETIAYETLLNAWKNGKVR